MTEVNDLEKEKRAAVFAVRRANYTHRRKGVFNVRSIEDLTMGSNVRYRTDSGYYVAIFYLYFRFQHVRTLLRLCAKIRLFPFRPQPQPVRLLPCFCLPQVCYREQRAHRPGKLRHTVRSSANYC